MTRFIADAGITGLSIASTRHWCGQPASVAADGAGMMRPRQRVD